MPWKAISPMDERIHFISLVNESDEAFSDICARFGISRKTGYKWLERYEEHGAEGLVERPSIAGSCPHATSQDIVGKLVELRKEYPKWGPKKLRVRLQAMGIEGPPAASTIGELLKKHGLIRPRRRRVFPPLVPSPLAEAQRPNDTWCVDFKGHFAVGDRTRCYPLTVSDHASRYLLKCEALARSDERAVRPCFEQVFREFGLPVRIRSDNGPPFATLGAGGLSELSIWWIRLGIIPERIEPGQPQQNGRHERMHRTLKEEVAMPPAVSMPAQQRAFDQLRHVYNTLRPHEALDMKTPESRYTSSRRPMPARLQSPEYPDTMQIRKLDSQGRLLLAGHKTKTTVSKLLKGEPVGLEQIDDDRWRLFYGPVLLAEVTRRNGMLGLDKLR